jgi:oxygen-independent coproporphyrinogen-3 oxidase
MTSESLLGRGEAPGLYLHVPFCLSKCIYCDFASATDQGLRELWFHALTREVEHFALRRGDSPPAHAFRGEQVRWPAFDTLYWGGGTPSLLSPEEVEGVMELVTTHVELLPTAEVTLEANPDDVTPLRLEQWRRFGFNRLSLGVQSLCDDELVWLQRRHNGAEARRAFESARRAGFDDISVDLMYGLPGQPLSAWRETLDLVATQWQPTHLSCYQLTVAQDTHLGRLVVTGDSVLPDEAEQRDFFVATHEQLEVAGYEHYEISNFARPGQRSRHNQKYWRHVPYLGLGAAAHSFDGCRRWWNHRLVPDYGAAWSRPGSPWVETELLDAEQLRLEQLMLGLRTVEGVPLSLALAGPRGQQAVDELVQQGLVRVHQDRLQPTCEGFLLADRLPLTLVD